MAIFVTDRMELVVRTVARLVTATQKQVCQDTGYTQGKVSYLVRNAVDLGLLVRTEDTAQPWQWTVVPDWQNRMADLSASAPAPRRIEVTPPPAIDWRPLYGAFGIFPP